MSELRTSIFWQVHTYCTGGCTYCPGNLWGGEQPRHVSEYLKVTKFLIDHYSKLGRTIDWTFDGGEPLEFFDFAEVLKLCKNNNGSISLRSNGGKIWMDWWAIEPNIDRLFLTYHYWQNYNLIKFIIQTFQAKNKFIEIHVPIRPDFFDEDFSRAELVEKDFSIPVCKDVLYVNAHELLGMQSYTKEQFFRLLGEDWVKNNFGIEKTYKERVEDSVNVSPIFTGQLCNTGIERLYISGDGWVKGSDCNNSPYGNIFHENFQLPTSATTCKMLSCTSPSDQRITKFS